MADLAELRMQQHIAHEIYRQQILQRIPGKKNIIRENNLYPSVLSRLWANQSIFLKKHSFDMGIWRSLEGIETQNPQIDYLIWFLCWNK